MIIGMDRETGQPITDVTHLRQSIRDILTTRIGTRTIARSYGSALMDLIDQPFNEGAKVNLIMAITSALDQWEPRIKVTRVAFVAIGDGQVTFDVEALYRPDQKAILVDGVVIQKQ